MIITTENVLGFVWFRSLIGGVLLWVMIRPSVGSFDKRQWIDVAFLGVAVALFSAGGYAALTHLPLGIMATLGFLGPLAVSVFGSRRLIDLLWPAIAFAGVYGLAPTDADAEYSWGAIGFGLLYAAAWAFYILVSARAGRSVKGLDAYVPATVMSALLLAPFGLSTISDFVATPGMLAAALGVAVLSTLTLGLEYIALKRIEPRVFGVLLSLEPGIASVVGILLLGELLSLTGWFAIAAVTVASIGAALGKRTKAA